MSGDYSKQTDDASRARTYEGTMFLNVNNFIGCSTRLCNVQDGGVDLCQLQIGGA